MSTYANSTLTITAAAVAGGPRRTRLRAGSGLLAVCLLLCSSAAFAARTHVVAWGGDVGNKTLDIPYSLDDAVAVAVPYVLRGNGDVLEIGTMPPVVRAGNAKAIDADGNCLLVLRRNGTVASLGDSSCPTAVPAGLSGVVAVAAGGSFALALTSDGNVVAWGYNGSGQTDVPVGLNNVIAIAAGRSHALALRSDGHVVAWGGNFDGELDIPAGLMDVVAIDAGGAYNQALQSDGTIVAWGDAYDYPRPVPLDLPPARALGAGKWRQAAAVLRDGTIREWGFQEGKALPPGLHNVQNLSMGYLVNFALVAGAITPGDAIADMRVDLNSLIAIEDADRSAMNSYLDLAASGVLANDAPLACEGVRSFAARVAVPDVFAFYPDRRTYFLSQSRDVMRLMGCPRWRDV
ncbi:RCC1 domain-containing protein [Lysobacter terrae]